MTELNIMTREAIRNRARRAFIQRLGRDAHDMNLGSAAIVDFQAEYDRLEAGYQAAMDDAFNLEAVAP